MQSKSIREEKGRKYFRTNFRLSFVGEHAEELSQEVLLWQCDKKYNVHIDYSRMSVFLISNKR